MRDAGCGPQGRGCRNRRRREPRTKREVSVLLETLRFVITPAQRCTRAELAAKHGEGHSTANLLDAVAASAESGAVSCNEVLLAPPKDLRLP